MKAIKYMLAGGVGLAAMAASAPASAQYYPNYGQSGNVIGQVLGQILNPGYGAYGGGYGASNQVLIDRCAAAVSDRVNRQYGNRYGVGYGGYNNAYAGGARVVAITSVEPRSSGRLRVRGIAQSSAPAVAYGGYAQVPVELSFKCNIDYRGYISDIDLNRTNTRYGYQAPYQPTYQPYGSYRRY